MKYVYIFLMLKNITITISLSIYILSRYVLNIINIYYMLIVLKQALGQNPEKEEEGCKHEKVLLTGQSLESGSVRTEKSSGLQNGRSKSRKPE